MTAEKSVKPSYRSLPGITDSAIEPLAQLPLPDVEQRLEILEKFPPARDALDVVMSGLQALAGRKLRPEQVKQDTQLIFAGLEKLTAVYGLFVGPATVISLYQSLLRVTGVNPDDAFPNGTWQFYVEYALREDTARHTVETYGFDTILRQHRIFLGQVDRMAAWVMAAVYCLRSYDRLLQNEWRERVYLWTLREVMKGQPEAAWFDGLYRQWEQERPYGRGRDAKSEEDYPAYRRTKFDAFLQEAMAGVSTDLRRQWVERVTQAKEGLAAYQKQMSILACLEPDVYDEVKRPLTPEETHIGIIYEGRYYFLPLLDKRTGKPMAVSAVRGWLGALVARREPPAVASGQLAALAMVQRSSWAGGLRRLSGDVVKHLAWLRTAPILLNFDQRPFELPLSQIRQAERGLGGHAITLFDTGKTFVFDLSHIFFDGIWGAGIAEILTNEALAWGVYLHQQGRPVPPAPQLPKPLPIQLTAADWVLVQKQPRVQAEASGETAVVNVRAIRGLRRLFKQRSDLLKLTVNDILILYRAIHAITYLPDPDLLLKLNTLAQRSATHEAATAALEALRYSRNDNPAVLIPVDASKRSPNERVHPVSFDLPLGELNLLQQHQASIIALNSYTKGVVPYQQFDELQREYLTTLATLGGIFAHVKRLAAQGETTSISSIKMLAHLPKSLQNLLTKIPERFEFLNDIFRGREVFSNVGAVVPGSTLTRFMTAKDDNEQKTLVWGVMTDAQEQMVITLRDFRPHVGKLIRVGHLELANRITQDYLVSYGYGLNDFIHELMRITLASRETDISSQSRSTNA